MTRRGGRDERGASMIMALVFVTVFGMTMAATLGYADQGFRTDRAVQERQSSLYGAGGALDTAIGAMRADLEWGAADAACATVPVVLMDGRRAEVTCTARGDAGAVQGRSVRVGAPPDVPSHALLTNSRPAEPGLAQAGGTLAVSGPVVASSSLVIAGGGTLDAGRAAVHAGGACPVGQIVSRPAAVCNAPTTNEISDALTRVGAPSVARPAVRRVPSCPGQGAYVALAPGQYDDAARLTALTDGSCPGVVVHLLPGTFWFNFGQRGLAAQWRITDPAADVIAGTPKDWTPGPWRARPSLPVAGACDADHTAGALLVFSRESALYVGAAHNVEVCASAAAEGQRIAIYGPTASTGAPAEQVQTRCVVLARGCPFIMVTGWRVGATSQLRVHGTVLAPSGAIGIDFARGGQAQFDRGVLVRSVSTWGSSSASLSPVFAVPASASAIPDRVVELVVTIDGVRHGRALVRFGDGGGDTPGATVTISEWNVVL